MLYKDLCKNVHLLKISSPINICKETSGIETLLFIVRKNIIFNALLHTLVGDYAVYDTSVYLGGINWPIETALQSAKNSAKIVCSILLKNIFSV